MDLMHKRFRVEQLKLFLQRYTEGERFLQDDIRLWVEHALVVNRLQHGI